MESFPILYFLFGGIVTLSLVRNFQISKGVAVFGMLTCHMSVHAPINSFASHDRLARRGRTVLWFIRNPVQGRVIISLRTRYPMIPAEAQDVES